MRSFGGKTTVVAVCLLFAVNALFFACGEGGDYLGYAPYNDTALS